MKLRFFTCGQCGGIIALIQDGGAPVTCCGEEMKELIPGTTEGAGEKHIPVYQVEGNRVKVCVGSAEHPMEEEHSIQWVAVETTQGAQFKRLLPGRKPEACFALCDADEAQSVYAYCNLHGLWQA